MRKLKIYTPGRGGLNIDVDPYLIADDELQQAANAYHDPTVGKDGALRKRPGLGKFNDTAAGDAILGGITMAVAGLGGAPQPSGNELTGDDTGGGDGTGAPGGTTDGQAPTQGASVFGGSGSTQLFSGARIIAIGRGDNNTTPTGNLLAGWYVTSKNIADTAVNVSTPGPPAVAYSDPPTTLFPMMVGMPCCLTNGYLYYASSHDQTSGVASPIRRTNGATDTLLTTIPTSTVAAAFDNGSVTTGNNRQCVTWMHAGSDGHIYIALKDKASGQTTAGNYGRVFRMTTSGGLTALPMYDSAILPSCVAYFNGTPFWGDFPMVTNEISGVAGAGGNLYSTSANISTGLYDQAYNSVFGGVAITSLLPFPSGDTTNQRLFVSTGISTGGVGSHALVWSRNQGAVAAGAIRLSLVSGGAGGTISFTGGVSWTDGGGSASTNGSKFSHMIEFNGNLYASYHNVGDAAKIYKLVPDYTQVETDGKWNGGGTWSIAFVNGSAPQRTNYYFFVDDGVLYALGAGGLGDIAQRSALFTTDGTTWTERVTNLPTGANQHFPAQFLIGVDQ